MSAVRYGQEQEFPTCGLCGREIDYEDCFNCGGEGGRELYEEDPLYYSPDDWEDCETCEGAGTLAFCPVHGVIDRVGRRPLVAVVDPQGRV